MEHRGIFQLRGRYGMEQSPDIQPQHQIPKTVTGAADSGGSIGAQKKTPRTLQQVDCSDALQKGPHEYGR